MNNTLIADFFSAADSRDPGRLVRTLTEDVVWTFGNSPTIHGHASIKGALSPLFQHVLEMNHRIVGCWFSGDCATAETRVRYRDQYHRTFEFPGCDLLFFRDSLIREVRIFVDNHELFLPPGKAS